MDILSSVSNQPQKTEQAINHGESRQPHVLLRNRQIIIVPDRRESNRANLKVDEHGNVHLNDLQRLGFCPVCEAQSSGFHYGVPTCESCKVFFKRAVKSGRLPLDPKRCKSTGNCNIMKDQRRSCRYCRFQKCLLVGMDARAVRQDGSRGGRNFLNAKYQAEKAKNVRARSSKDNVSVDKIVNIANSQLTIPVKPQQPQTEPNRSPITPIGHLLNGNASKIQVPSVIPQVQLPKIQFPEFTQQIPAPRVLLPNLIQPTQMPQDQFSGLSMMYPFNQAATYSNGSSSMFTDSFMSYTSSNAINPLTGNLNFQFN